MDQKTKETEWLLEKYGNPYDRRIVIDWAICRISHIEREFLDYYLSPRSILPSLVGFKLI